MIYYCYLCKDWEDLDSCESHFQNSHNSPGMTQDALKKRYACLGGLETKENSPDDENLVRFETNNFTHYL